MKAVAVICEFNPFHKGHILLAREIKKAFPEYVLTAVMSGNTVQRGELAIFDKYERARTAIENGYDAVFELPFPYSCSAGEQFARAGVHIAAELGAEILAFGSESGDIGAMLRIVENLEKPNFIELVNEYAVNNRNISAIEARNIVYRNVYGGELPSQSNDILALEYLGALKKGNYPLKPHAVHRTENFKASDAREAIRKCDEDEKKRVLAGEQGYEINEGLAGISDFILGALRTDMRSDNGNGIVNALKLCAKKAANYDEFISLLPTKTYTSARLRREIIAYLFDVTDADKNIVPEYTVLLAAGKKGQEYISSVRKNLKISILTKYSDAQKLGNMSENMLKKAITVDSIYYLGYKSKPKPIPFKIPYMN